MLLQEFCYELPKVVVKDLHAHLNGSLSINALQRLGVPINLLKKYEMNNIDVACKNKLKECFKLFKVAHSVTNTVESVCLATKLVIEEFHKDKVIYLELRTTPKQTDFMSKKEYLEAIIKAINHNNTSTIVKLVPSINREHNLETSYEVLKIILEMHKIYPNIIRGIDLSGDPNLGKFYKELFTKAREHRLNVTLHCAEIKNCEETEEMLKFKPDRIGHATCIHPKHNGSYKLWELYRKLKIPIECCLTSNVMCETVQNYKEHHMKEWLQNDLPFSINTDDKGVFSTNLSKEYIQAALSFNLSQKSLTNSTLAAIKSSFAADEEKMKLINIVSAYKNNNSII